jgi:hypothetical protein
MPPANTHHKASALVLIIVLASLAIWMAGVIGGSSFINAQGQQWAGVEFMRWVSLRCTWNGSQPLSTFLQSTGFRATGLSCNTLQDTYELCARVWNVSFSGFFGELNCLDCIYLSAI